MVSSTAVRTAPEQKKVQDSGGGTLPHATVSYDTAGRLVDSLLHDARNPLNAIAINLEVLSEKLKDEAGTLPPSYEKNLKAMREQIFRVDAILRQFAEFIAPRPASGALLDLSEVVRKVQEVVAHESRKRRVKMQWNVEAGLSVRCEDTSAIHLVVLHPVMRALQRSEAGGEVQVSLAKDGATARLVVKDAASHAPDSGAHALEALGQMVAQNKAQLRSSGGECEIAFPLA